MSEFRDNVINYVKDKINLISNYEILIGVFSGDSKRREKIKVGITNAELMFIHENGSPLNSIPARPVLQMTIDYANQNLLIPTINKALAAYGKEFKVEDFEKELRKLCLRMENYARHIIYDNDGRLVPNSPRVARKKGGNHPLFDTGQLARSITCELVKI